YELGHEAAVGTHGDTFVPDFNDAAAEVSFSSDSITVGAGESTEVTVTVTPPAQDFDQMVYGGYVTVEESGEETYRVPYAAYNGNYQQIERSEEHTSELQSRSDI